MRIIKVLLFHGIDLRSAFAQQSLKPGTAAPDFNAESLDGKIFNLSQLQGKIVVLTFWSTDARSATANCQSSMKW